MSHSLLAAILLCLAACIPQGGGPSPRALLVISSENYSLEQVLGTLDSLSPTLDARIDKKVETIQVGESKIPRYQQYDIAYWYPQNGSDTYGVAIVKWVSNLNGPDAKTMTNRYFIDVYADDTQCALCSAVKDALAKREISFFSACERPDQRSTHESIRCGT
jgi:hypothetical protein